MKKILAFAGSNSSSSINYKLIDYTVALIKEYRVKILDIRKWDVPIYSEDMDAVAFTPENIEQLIGMIKEYDGYIISVPEHNGGASAFFKNIVDWLSRRSIKVMEDKPILLLSTSPGRGGALLSREYHERTLPRLGARIAASYGLPSFNFSMVDGKLVEEEQINLENAIIRFNVALESEDART